MNADKMDEIKKRNFSEHIQNDVEQHQAYIGRKKLVQEAYASSQITGSVYKEELNAICTYERVVDLIDRNNLKIISQDGKEYSANNVNNNWPAQSYLLHGSRITLQIPKNSGKLGDELFCYITSGNKNHKAASTAQSKEGAMKEGCYFYNRLAATHKVGHIKKEGEEIAVEEKGLWIGVKGAIISLFYSALSYVPLLGSAISAAKKSVTQNWGLDLALNKEKLGIDMEHGHLYLYYEPATSTKPGAILLGIEASAPYSPKHSKLGASDPYSATDGAKWEDLAEVKAPPGTVIPRKYDGMRIEPEVENLTQFLEESSKQKGVCNEYYNAPIMNKSDEYINADNMSWYEKAEKIINIFCESVGINYICRKFFGMSSLDPDVTSKNYDNQESKKKASSEAPEGWGFCVIYDSFFCIYNGFFEMFSSNEVSSLGENEEEP